MTRKKRLKLLYSDTPYQTPQSFVESQHKIKSSDLKQIQPLTKNQQKFFDAYDDDVEAMMLHGLAGTGKTFIAMYNAFCDIFHRNFEYRKVIIVRSAVPSRDIGHLPGNEKEKSEVYLQPYKEICAELFPRLGDKAYMKLKEQNLIEFMITSHIRGITLENAIIIVDEIQNLNSMEINSIMTRVGKNSKIILCGDFRQTDLNKKHDQSGLPKLMKIIDYMDSFEKIEFGVDDIVRSTLVKEWIVASMQYDDQYSH